MNQDKFYRALSQLTDQDISPELFQELEQHLLSSDEARQQYREYMQLQSLVGLEIDVHHRDQKLLPVEKILSRQKRRAVQVAMLSAAAILVLGLLAMRFYLMPEPSSMDLVFQASPGTQFELSHGESQGEKPVGNLMQPGSSLKISQGAVELQFASGVKSVVMAPADLTLRSESELYLKEGRAWFHVPEQAVGFTVKTGDLDVVDLGTKFGVLAQPGQHDEVHVLKGKVEVSAQRLRKESRILLTGEACRIDPIGRLVDLPVKPSAFVDTLPDTLPYIHWSFDQPDEFQVKGSHPFTGDVAAIAVGGPESCQGPLGDALSLDSDGQHVSTNWPGFSGDRPRTVAFWIKLPLDGQPDGFGGIVGWGDNSQEGGKWALMARQNELGAGQLALFWGQSSVKTPTEIESEKWYHVLVSDSSRTDDRGVPDVKFYFNGKRVKNQHHSRLKDPVSTVTATVNAMPLTIGATIRHLSVKKRIRYLKAQIDELYIFDGAMSDEQARKFAEQQLSHQEKNRGDTPNKTQAIQQK